jgi:DNA-binding NtrC family response regulator
LQLIESSPFFNAFGGIVPAELHQGFRVDPADLPEEEVIFGGTPAMEEVRARIGRILDADFPVLLQGERGTGKDLVARFLHARSNRSDGPFVKLSCAAIPQRSLESELLGSEDASGSAGGEGKTGLIEVAEGGTLFLDEISEMGLTLQRKLLHLLRDGRYFRAGSRMERQANVRILCASNVKLDKAVRAGRFRKDLFEQMDVLCFRLAPLRERKTDIPRLWEYFAGKLARKFGRTAPALTPAALEVLEQWDWPGNLCELENCIARVMILGDEKAIGEGFRRQAALADARHGRPERNRSKLAVRPAAAEAMILQVLEANRWNRRKATEELKRSYRSLLYRLRKSGIQHRPRSPRAFPRPE